VPLVRRAGDHARKALAIEERTDPAHLLCRSAGGLGFAELRMRRGQNGMRPRALL
jgi:hypothetical protein